MSLPLNGRHDGNNFNLIRLVAATLVLLSHSFSVATGSELSEPLRSRFGLTLGSLSVDMFFIISGLLVTHSLLRSGSARTFAASRFFRIWPALTLAICLTVLVLGPCVTTLAASQYFSSKATWLYLVRGVSLFSGVGYYLPGVFVNNPLPAQVNASLWTLPREVACYLALLLIWSGSVRVSARSQSARRLLIPIVIAILVVLTALNANSMRHTAIEASPYRLFLSFSIGAALCLFGERVSLRIAAFAGAVVSAVVLAFIDVRVFGAIYPFMLAYAVVFLAYVPKGFLLGFNRLGDISYGTYIYAFPVQQLVALAIPGIGLLALFSISLSFTWLLAALSWKYLEKPAIGYGRRRWLAAGKAELHAVAQVNS